MLPCYAAAAMPRLVWPSAQGLASGSPAIASQHRCRSRRSASRPRAVQSPGQARSTVTTRSLRLLRRRALLPSRRRPLSYRHEAEAADRPGSGCPALPLPPPLAARAIRGRESRLPLCPSLLQEAGDRAAAAGNWGVAILRWDAALGASPAEPHKLHEAKAQVGICGSDEAWCPAGMMSLHARRGAVPRNLLAAAVHAAWRWRAVSPPPPPPPAGCETSSCAASPDPAPNATPGRRCGWRLGRTGRRCSARSGPWSCSRGGPRGTSRCRERRCAEVQLPVCTRAAAGHAPVAKQRGPTALAACWNASEHCSLCYSQNSPPALLPAAAQHGRAGAGAAVDGARAAAGAGAPRGSGRGHQHTHTGAAAAAGWRGGGGAAGARGARAWRRWRGWHGELTHL